MKYRIAGRTFEHDRADYERAMQGVLPETIRSHWVAINAIKYPAKQPVQHLTGLNSLDFTTQTARSILRRIGFDPQQDDAR